MATPGKTRPSGNLGPGHGRLSGIPTPGRSRSTSNVHANFSANNVDDMSRAFVDAIKANDPAHHRVFTPISSLSPTTSQPGSQPVLGRPSSAASTSSAFSSGYLRGPERSKTPVSVRPLSRPSSRHSDIFGKTLNRTFEVGDNVRIESLGYEGTLKYIGEIEGKNGLWAGVELSGGFTGKGKNDGSVNGRRYFFCPENCGVFVASNKLSPPTVGPGAVTRPSSVASSRGRTTPGIPGRCTPSFTTSTTKPPSAFANGRVTPNHDRMTPISLNGRCTPIATPSTSARARTITRTPTLNSLADMLTAGSRASKYISMTAQQLSSRDASKTLSRHESENPPSENPPIIPSSPTAVNRAMPSPTRASPFTTPKAGPSRITISGSSGSSLPPTKGRPSINTPRPRIPSGVAMPPPASPIPLTRSVTSNKASNMPYDDTVSISDLQLQGSVLQAKLASLTSDAFSEATHPQPESASSVRFPPIENIISEQLRSRLEALEYENERLRTTNAVGDSPTLSPELEKLKVERNEAVERIEAMEGELAMAAIDRQTYKKQTEKLDDERVKLSLELERQMSKAQGQIEILQERLEEGALEIQSLRDVIDSHKRQEVESGAVLEGKQKELDDMRSKLEKTRMELDYEKRELLAQIDELREAGQETIALYEERLNSADSQRYELENRISVLETEARLSATLTKSESHSCSSAVEIDNETLRDQVLHLQRKIATMEDMIEDSRVASERDEAAFRDRMKRLKEKEDGMRKELNEGRREVEHVVKSETNARRRIEEIEEALRESTVALENARAEVETLRADLANVESLVGDDGMGDLSFRLNEYARRVNVDRTQREEAIKELQRLLEELRTSVDNSSQVQRHLESHNYDLLKRNEDLESRIDELQRDLGERNNEIEALKKKSNRDVPYTNGLVIVPPSPSKHDLSAAREEITGLKHIVQELQKENSAKAQQLKLLESENTLLSSEADQLRQEVQILEDNLDNSGMTHNEAVSDRPPSLQDVDSLQRMLREQKARFETELEQLRKRIAETEMKHAREAHDLNKEISELETLVESKIYREDELEQEVERLKERVARHKKASKGSIESVEKAGDLCEICERRGHDIFTCDLLKTDKARSVDLICEDCEGHGHVAADCPHSQEVF